MKGNSKSLSTRRTLRHTKDTRKAEGLNPQSFVIFVCLGVLCVEKLLTFGKRETENGKRFLRFFPWHLLFNGHVLEFAGFEDFAAEFALYVLGVFIARDYAHSGVLTGFGHWGPLGG
jgi:hypothetical protein